MSQAELLKKTTAALDRLGAPFMLTGSLASSMQGEPRATHVVDLFVQLELGHVDPLLQAFPPPDYYLNESAVREAIAQRGMFNLLDVREGDKVDFWPLTDDAFDQSRFARRRPFVHDGVSIDVSSPEDTILMKLSWSHRSGGGERQDRDALRVFEVQYGTLDLSYLEHWVHTLDLHDEGARLLANARRVE